MDVLTGLLYLTLNIYHEARSEDQLNQLAVAHVTLNRARQKNLPIKDVVLQPFQFSWTIDTNPFDIKEPEQLLVCLESAFLAIDGFDFTDGSTYYHLKRVHPYWADHYQLIAQFGSHLFYKDGSK